MPDEPQGWTPDDVETLAEFVGWNRVGGSWNPFQDARHDLQVLERAREVWSLLRNPIEMHAFYRALKAEVEASSDLGWAVILRYSAGCYARAALAVLKEMEAEG